MISIKKPIDLVLDRAKEFHSDGDYDNELACYDKLYSIYSNSSKSLNKILNFQQHTVENWNSCLKTISLIKNFGITPELLNKEAYIYTELNQYDKAIKNMHLSFKQVQGDFSMYNFLCMMYSHNSSLIEEGFIFFNQSLKSDKDNVYFNYSLALLHYNKELTKDNRDFTIALQYMNNCYQSAPDKIEVLNLFGIISSVMQRFQDSLVYLLKSLAINDNNPMAHLNLGYLFSQELFPTDPPPGFIVDDSLSGGNTDKIDKAVFHLKKAFDLNPKDYFSLKHLGNLYLNNKYYSEAIEIFKKIPDWEGKEGLIQCYYLMNDYDNYTALVSDPLSTSNISISRVLSTFLSHSEIHINSDVKNYFCPKPTDYIHSIDASDLDGLPNYNQRLLKELDSCDLGERSQALLTNGVQASLNLFNLDSSSYPLITILKDFVITSVNEYRNLFHNSETGMVMNWPDNFFINGWIIKMKEGGYLSPHNHELGWVSGVYYLQVPIKNNSSEGDIKFSLEHPKFPISNLEFPKKLVTTKDSRLILFPSSLYHQTIPFSDDVTRICIAFDMQPV